MMDYHFVDDAGRMTPVSQMSTFEIVACLDAGVYLAEPLEEGVTVEGVEERLRIELVARGLGL